MTQLRKRMVEELQRRNYAPSTIESYVHAVQEFSRYFKERPDRLTQEHLRQYHLYLIKERKLAVSTVVVQVAALRFFLFKTLQRPYVRVDLPYPKRCDRLPTVLSPQEVGRLLDSAGNRFHFAMLMTLYSTGMRRATSLELCRQLLGTAPLLPSEEIPLASPARLCPSCHAPTIVTERLTAMQIAWRFVTKCFSDTS